MSTIDGVSARPRLPEREAINQTSLATAGRFTGATTTPSAGPESPEATEQAAIGLIEEFDASTMDIPNRNTNIAVSDAEIDKQAGNADLGQTGTSHEDSEPHKQVGTRMTRFWQSAIFAIAAVTAMAAGAQAVPKFESRAAATAALSAADAGKRLGAIVYFARNGVAHDGPLMVKRLKDKNPLVRKAAEQAVWLVWSRSGNAETDRLLNNGTVEMNAGHLEKAIAIFSQVIKRDPAFAEGWNKRATAYYLAGDLQKSLADCDEVMKRNPQHFGALSGYGEIYVQLKEYHKAIDYFRRALAVNPNMADVKAAIEQLEEIVREQRRNTI